MQAIAGATRQVVSKPPIIKNDESLKNKHLLMQLENLDLAEDMMLRNNLGAAEKLLLEMLSEDDECIPVLSNLGHLYGRHLSEFETAIEYYNRVLQLEPDNAWARDARRRYLRYVE